MDGLTLLSEAGAAGLTILAAGDRLIIRGPKSADVVARRLLAHKAMVLAALTAGNGNTTPANPTRIGSCVDSGPSPWDEATEPGAGCPVCGSLESWQDALGRERCGVCEADALDRALELADKAAWLRRQDQERKSAPRIAPCCVPAVSVDTQDLDSKRPRESNQRALWGCENG